MTSNLLSKGLSCRVLLKAGRKSSAGEETVYHLSGRQPDLGFGDGKDISGRRFVVNSD